MKSENKKNNDTELTPVQEKAIYLLASGKSITDVAKEINTDRGTIYNWFLLSEFEAFYNRVRYELKTQCRNELLSMHSQVIQTINDILKSENETLKLKTAMFILQNVNEFQTGFTNKTDIEKEKRHFAW